MAEVEETPPARDRPRRPFPARLLLGGLAALGLIALGYAFRTGAAIDAGRPAVTAPAPPPVTAPPRVDPGAYDAVLRARYLSVRTTDADTQAAIALLERAIALDPGYALAHADLAAAYVTRLTFVTPEESGDLDQKAFAAAERVLRVVGSCRRNRARNGRLVRTGKHAIAPAFRGRSGPGSMPADLPKRSRENR